MVFQRMHGLQYKYFVWIDSRLVLCTKVLIHKRIEY